MKTITLTGWGHPHDALDIIAPGALHLEYTAQNSLEDALDLLAKNAENAEKIIGWSMGGQVAAYAIAKKIIAPKKLILISSAYRFLAKNKTDIGMQPDIHKQFSENLKRNRERSFKKSYALISHGDTRAEVVEKLLQTAFAKLPNHNWEYWFAKIAEIDFADFDMTHFPETTIIHGARDVVVSVEQAAFFARAIPNSNLHIIENSGHAPHLHNEDIVKAMI